MLNIWALCFLIFEENDLSLKKIGQIWNGKCSPFTRFILYKKNTKCIINMTVLHFNQIV